MFVHVQYFLPIYHIAQKIILYYSYLSTTVYVRRTVFLQRYRIYYIQQQTSEHQYHPVLLYLQSCTT